MRQQGNDCGCGFGLPASVWLPQHPNMVAAVPTWVLMDVWGPHQATEISSPPCLQPPAPGRPPAHTDVLGTVTLVPAGGELPTCPLSWCPPPRSPAGPAFLSHTGHEKGAQTCVGTAFLQGQSVLPDLGCCCPSPPPW